MLIFLHRLFGAIGYGLGSLVYASSINFFPSGGVSCYVGMYVTYAVLTTSLGVVCFWMLSIPVDGSSKVEPSSSDDDDDDENLCEPEISLKKVEGKTQDPEIILVAEMTGGGTELPVAESLVISGDTEEPVNNIELETLPEINDKLSKPDTGAENKTNEPTTIVDLAKKSMKKCAMLFTTVYILAIFQGIWFSYAYVFLKELNGPTMLIGISFFCCLINPINLQ